jgi:hypothetical protein
MHAQDAPSQLCLCCAEPFRVRGVEGRVTPSHFDHLGSSAICYSSRAARLTGVVALVPARWHAPS